MNWVFWAVIFIIALFIWIMLSKLFPEIGHLAEDSKDRTIGRKEDTNKKELYPITISIVNHGSKTFTDISKAKEWLRHSLPYTVSTSVEVHYKTINLRIDHIDQTYILYCVYKFLDAIKEGEF